MAEGMISLEKRLKDNIRNYSLKSLYDSEILIKQAELLCDMFGLSIMVTDRHGEESITFGGFIPEKKDVIKEPGRKMRVCDRTIAHIYFNDERVPLKDREWLKNLTESMITGFEALGEKNYLYQETMHYADELEEKLERETYQAKHGEKQDELTGVLNRTYFENRVKIVDRSQIAPVAAICININDWKFANEHFGDEESDRLIQIVAKIIQENAKPEYIIGRVDGDVFHVLIPVPEENECQIFSDNIQKACDSFSDTCLAPSIAVGIVMKENVEESLQTLFSDAEYEMFNHKLEIKSRDGYQERLYHGIHV